ncbi:hypothetical protein [Roseibium sediminis]|uniref:hypothetical protein n=1 Tax=Roseibium sediminis TaxID=1775174 RepID=UPI00123CBCE4|nr:hypothetical protein [Roseibium sediminis]
MTYFFELIPPWLFGIVLGGLFILAYRHLGRTGLISAISTAVLLFVYREGKKGAEANIKRDMQAVNQKALKEMQEIENETDSMSDDELDADNSPWVRNKN